MAYLFADLLNQAPTQIRNNVADARDWIQQNVRTVQQSRVINAPSERRSRTPPFGGMCMFLYTAKTRDKLPYWDKFPLVIPIGGAPGGFLGMNLHYISPIARARLFDAMERAGVLKDGNIRASYELLNKASTLKLFKPCVKRYLNNYVKSSFITIYPDEYNVALFLPTERFVGAGKGRVYADSADKVGNI